MGAWEELDTEISVELELDDLDSVISLEDEYGIFEEVKTYADNLKTAMETGAKKGVKDLAKRDRSFQQQLLAQNCKHPTGMLSSSIQEEEQDEYTWLIGTTINHIYPMSIEFGRSEVHPYPPKKRLRFYGEGGYLIFPKMSRDTWSTHKPFVAPAYTKTDAITETIMMLYIGQEMSRIK